MRKLLAFILSVFLASCSTPRVEKADWVECWNICGKKDTLNAVSGDSCFCSDGTERRFTPIEESRSVFDMIGVGQP